MLFIWGDSSRRFKDGSAAKDDLNKYYLDVLYSNTDRVNVTNSKLKTFYGIGLKGFNLVSCQFSIHYFFESVIKLNMFLKNVSENLTTDGVFIGTCLDSSLLLMEFHSYLKIYLQKPRNPVYHQY